MNYEIIEFNTEKSGICPSCKKRATRREKFWQTINPFNRDENGYMKTRRQIQQELKIEVDNWHNEPVFHAKCEGY